MSQRAFAWLALFAGLGLVPGCSQLIGIEDAHVDATLAATEGSVAGNSATAGNNASPSAGAGATSTQAHNHGGTGNDSTPATAGDSSKGGEMPDLSGTGGAPPEPTLCERYCEQVTTNCKGKYEQYRTFDQCVEVCKRLPPGETGDDNVNSVSCRIKQAEFAESEPFVYCKSAGPLGGGRCGSNCVSYCSLMQVTCTAESTAGNLEASYFQTSQACIADCSGIPTSDAGPVQYSSSATAEPSSFIGNNVYCRTYHLAAALEQDTPDEHCPHAMGGDPCIDP